MAKSSAKKQMVDPAASSSDTVVNLSVIALPLYIIMNRRDASTHPFRSPIHTVNGCDLTPPPRLQTSVQDYNDLTASFAGCRQLHNPATHPTAFLHGVGLMFSRGRQNMRGHIWRTQKIFRKLVGE